jgi:chloride channel protein, CIC family
MVDVAITPAPFATILTRCWRRSPTYTERVADDSHSERQRVPQPLIKRRIASGRGAIEQPNATHDGEASLSLRFWAALLVAGVLTGLAGAGLMGVLWVFEHVAFGYQSGSFTKAVTATSGARRVIMLGIAGGVGAVGWYGIRRFLGHQKSEIDDALWHGDARLHLTRSTLTSVLSEIVIGMGASIGREAAPKLMGGALSSWVSDRVGLSDAQRRLLVACAGGAGLACVYNVPLGGALFVAEVLYGSFALPTVLAALTCSSVATGVVWLFLGHATVYGNLPAFHLSASLMVFALVAGLLIGPVAVFWIRIIGWVSHRRASGRMLFVAMPLTFVVVGAVGCAYPSLFGNGKDIAHDAFLGVSSVGLLAALFVLKPLVTAATLGSGAAGGVFTPFLATGAVTGALLGTAWLHLWGGPPLASLALIGAAAMIGAAMQAPLAGIIIVIELTSAPLGMAVPIALATVVATWFVRYVDGYSIYSARLPGARES